ncbi:MAG: nicotinate-nucleotide adenylyltransferase [Deltaproteobacteria bacterium]|nr:nicotinate-nucleotide adenylyltransferase [Deltaproteobacteria bacterium]
MHKDQHTQQDYETDEILQNESLQSCCGAEGTPTETIPLATTSDKYKIFRVENNPLPGDRSELKIGILGGTFNPPHMGHLRLAEEAVFAHGLDRAVFIPASVPPHKDTKEIAGSRHRLEMTRRACRGNPCFEVSDVELTLEGTSYTVKTLQLFAKDPDNEIFFILGADSLREIPTWRDYEELFSLSSFIVVNRPGTDFETAWAELPSSLRLRFRQGDGFLAHSSSHLLIPSPVKGLDISSTRIRSLLRQGLSIRYLVPESVRTYILENHLYGC